MRYEIMYHNDKYLVIEKDWDEPVWTYHSAHPDLDQAEIMKEGLEARERRAQE